MRIPAGLIASVRRELRFPTGSAPADGVLDVPVAGQTSFTVELTEPLTVRRLLARPVDVRTVHCHADDPAAAVAAVRALLPSPADV
ncbi:hypothetical protein [Streptomyces albireticuli]|uniref:hypothetical protein n=1 Tax=Streptomyces albireticuli TaxID=1940 RepID=UPI001E610B4E|nr:hypothetical protein [Streptomyces albireticuli]MCD9141986.1 hypothetical protein [Streptomyces albireticuli]MCD9163070.1 hypothetical protein [Streptomyces albireticuli]MCD9190160.1 hypothetical protein [Streptomyces albireticuli]